MSVCFGRHATPTQPGETWRPGFAGNRRSFYPGCEVVVLCFLLFLFFCFLFSVSYSVQRGPNFRCVTVKNKVIYVQLLLHRNLSSAHSDLYCVLTVAVRRCTLAQTCRRYTWVNVCWRRCDIDIPRLQYVGAGVS